MFLKTIKCFCASSQFSSKQHAAEIFKSQLYFAFIKTDILWCCKLLIFLQIYRITSDFVWLHYMQWDALYRVVQTGYFSSFFKRDKSKLVTVFIKKIMQGIFYFFFEVFGMLYNFLHFYFCTNNLIIIKNTVFYVASSGIVIFYNVIVYFRRDKANFCCFNGTAYT